MILKRLPARIPRSARSAVQKKATLSDTLPTQAMSARVARYGSLLTTTTIPKFTKPALTAKSVSMLFVRHISVATARQADATVLPQARFLTVQHILPLFAQSAVAASWLTVKSI